MTDAIATFPDPETVLSRLPALVVGHRGAARLSVDGEITSLKFNEAARALADEAHLVCNLPLITRKLRLNVGQTAASFDLLELFAFVRPARFTLPTIFGLAQSLSLAHPPTSNPIDDVAILGTLARCLLADLSADTYRWHKGVAATAMAMARSGWPWGPVVLGALGPRAERSGGLAAWQGLPEWEDGAPPPPPSDHSVSEDEASQRLASLLGDGSEARPAQAQYSRSATHAFHPRAAQNAPNLALAEAGTGTGKTLGYIAPASLWAQKNGGPVWLSTYTKALQRQIDQELARLYPDPKERAAKTVIRKGRENYACLLNVEEAARISFAGAAGTRDAVLMGLVLRWLSHTRDGDMVGGDFPSWLGGYFGRARLGALTDHRGECLYSACAHYRRCFIERVVRKTRRAELVVANHALVMTQAASRKGDPDLPRRLVFDEGHHVFDAADSAFSAHLSGAEGAELRRWLRGRETATKGRARGLLSRVEDLLTDDDVAMDHLRDALEAARLLPGPGWLGRLTTDSPRGPYEQFLGHIRAQIFSRVSDARGPHGLECGTESPSPDLLKAADLLARAMTALSQPLTALAKRLIALLDEEADSLDSASRGRLDATARALSLRSDMVRAWGTMLADLKHTRDPAFVDWFALDRMDGREVDAGLYRHWLDPTKPFADTVLEPAHGVLVTSATLLDQRTAMEDEDWSRAETRVGASHLVLPAKRFSLSSPFDYAANTRILVVNDLRKGDVAQLAAAYRALFLAANGGALGLFTAIARLRAVHDKIMGPLEQAGLPLYAQHIDPIETGTLVDMFRAEEQACLLGTDAVRDGVDVPGSSLRLIVFDRVPWPRPTLLHKARRAAFGGALYDDMLTRLKLSQAFGRLVRRASDRGIFVLLDAQTPSRLLSAFPDGPIPERVGLAKAIDMTRDFFNTAPSPENPER
ncbi:DNA helicase [Iodidimonas muriae]|uniref:DNA helicase n=1 Tax=Iodidimonas muriae TaxID=261467 RepID=A0ABQ2LEB5_9PROT|nr:ATP-dependent DNA helicase [Iodidimonas muriae]GGO11954.1 DNA helicase [Iodidimonas muriae]